MFYAAGLFLMAMAAGTLIMTIFGSFFNAVYLLPKFSALFGMPMEARKRRNAFTPSRAVSFGFAKFI